MFECQQCSYQISQGACMPIFQTEMASTPRHFRPMFVSMFPLTPSPVAVHIHVFGHHLTTLRKRKLLLARTIIRLSPGAPRIPLGDASECRSRSRPVACAAGSRIARTHPSP